MPDKQFTTATFTNSEVNIVTHALSNFDGKSKGFEDQVESILQKLRPGIPPLSRIDKIAAEKIEQMEAEVSTLNCNNIACNQSRDILASIYEAMAQLPCNGVNGILCGAAQEIAALRAPADKEAMQKAWDDWHSTIPADERPAVSLAFEKGFNAGAGYDPHQPSPERLIKFCG